MSYLLTQYGIDIEIDVTPFESAPTWAPICDGWNNLTEAMNEQAQEYFFLCGKGYGSTEVTGIHPVLQLTGVRKIGDTAQDFIMRQRLNLMEGRKTTLRLSIANADGTVTRFTNKVTMSNVSSFGGATTDGAAISCDFAFNGRPIVEIVAASTSLTVTSVAGAAVGQTVITVVPTYPDAGCKFVWKDGDTAPVATVGSVIADWNDFTNGATYSPAGSNATVAMVNTTTFVVVGSGSVALTKKT